MVPALVLYFCWAKYRRGFGCYVELCVDGVLFKMKAECPDENLLYTRAMTHDNKFDPQSPEELYSPLKSIEPTVNEIVELVDKEKSLYQMKSKADFDSLPEFNWYDIFPRKETKSKKNKRG